MRPCAPRLLCAIASACRRPRRSPVGRDGEAKNSLELAPCPSACLLYFQAEPRDQSGQHRFGFDLQDLETAPCRGTDRTVGPLGNGEPGNLTLQTAGWSRTRRRRAASVFSAEVDGCYEEVGVDRHKPGEIDFELRLDIDRRPASVQSETLGGRPVDLDACPRARPRGRGSRRFRGLASALTIGMPAAMAAAHEEAQARVRRHVQLRLARDLRVFSSCRRVVGDLERKFLQLAGSDAGR